jgi:5-azacytidine-induced protein 1
MSNDNNPLTQEAWRAAVAERAKQEVEQREAALRRQLVAERDEEIRGVIVRLEAEFLAKEEAVQVGV